MPSARGARPRPDLTECCHDQRSTRARRGRPRHVVAGRPVGDRWPRGSGRGTSPRPHRAGGLRRRPAPRAGCRADLARRSTGPRDSCRCSSRRATTSSSTSPRPPPRCRARPWLPRSAPTTDSQSCCVAASRRGPAATTTSSCSAQPARRSPRPWPTASRSPTCSVELIHRRVTAAFLSAAEPKLSDAVAAQRIPGRRVVVATYLLAPGLFADLAAAARRRCRDRRPCSYPQSRHPWSSSTSSSSAISADERPRAPGAGEPEDDVDDDVADRVAPSFRATARRCRRPASTASTGPRTGHRRARATRWARAPPDWRRQPHRRPTPETLATRTPAGRGRVPRARTSDVRSNAPTDPAATAISQPHQATALTRPPPRRERAGRPARRRARPQPPRRRCS